MAGKQALAGFGAGFTSTTILHPLDMVKTRLQGKYAFDDADKRHRKPMFGRTVSMLRAISHQDGLRGLYRGLTPNLAGATASWALYFWWYDMFKARATKDEHGHMSPGQHLIASAQAGALTAITTNPLWVVKTRMCVTNRTDQHAYRGLLDGLGQIARKEGIRGLYKGMVPALFGVSHGALQFMAYEDLKKWRINVNPAKNKERLSTLEYMVMASTSKLFATVSTYPYQVLRSRLQNQQEANQKYRGVADAIGLLGFYKGLAPNALRVLPGTCITFVVYENLSAYFREHARPAPN
ncbi:mitochondrial carrier domain-containing protein [Syncephalis pseudoplumigaleata]|uniref:Mitochondrial carrier domain-containing protein n=1 Tax=Syncephalis pseudoplumigaleata TaxID=1712513 RepID=A0A4P9Z312_9FUNG|nr:mitochondrial carrier domain-containing protein [Syncephalis pseudoplumigaleata]|eukprot:RKP26768.1 mitochondrial carrier domain-containing protein [Syncephalis pseudoplumigaleata]